MKNLMVIIIVFFSILKSNACSYVTGSFKWKTQSSELIIKGKVLRVHKYGERSETAIALLELKSLLKGEYKNKTIEIQIDLTRTCPGPAKYVEGDTVITFLNKISKGDGYITNGYFHGVKSFDKESVRELYENRIIELVEIQKKSNAKPRTKELIKWAIKCAKNEETRYIASEEFHFIGYYYRYDKKKKRYTKEKHARLTRNQKKEIRELLLSIEDFKYSDCVLLESIAKNNDKQLLKLALIHLEKYDKDKPIWIKEVNLMKSIVKISKRKDLELVLKEIEVISIYSRNLELNNLTEKFINKMKIQPPTMRSTHMRSKFP